MSVLRRRPSLPGALLLAVSQLVTLSRSQPHEPSPLHEPALPENLKLSDTMRPFVLTMWKRSPTFRQQCARLGAHEKVIVSIELAAALTDARALSRLERYGGRLTVRIRIDWRSPQSYAELIAHELEHVLEQIDGIDLPRLARQRLDGVVDRGGSYETARADAVGRTVAGEVLIATRSARVRVGPMVARLAVGVAFGFGAGPAALPPAGPLAMMSPGLGREMAEAARPVFVSRDGRLIAFDSPDYERAPGACCQQVYVLDRTRGVRTQETLGVDGARLNADSQGPSLSADEQVIAFETYATNLPGDSTRHVSPRVVVRDRRTGTLWLPRGPHAEEPDGLCWQPAVSGDGLSVVFTSRARNLVAGADANHDESDILLWRLDDSTITRVSVDNRGAQPSVGYSYSATVSHDGQWVAFVSTARLVSEDSNNAADVYLRNVRRGTTSLISRGMGGRLADGVSHAPMLSADGRFVVFVSKAGNLVPRDRNGQPDVFVYDVANRAIRLVSAAATGDTANADSRRPAISGDGRVIVYESVASNLGTGPGCPRVVSDTNLVPDVYLLDRTTRCVTRVSGSAQGEWWTPSVGPAIDGLGRLVVFSSTQPTSVDDLSADFHLFMFLRP